MLREKTLLFVLYKRKVGHSFTHRLRVFEIKLLRILYASKEKQVPLGLRHLHYPELYTFWPSWHIIR
jgi:hypothetical protein